MLQVLLNASSHNNFKNKGWKAFISFIVKLFYLFLNINSAKSVLSSEISTLKFMYSLLLNYDKKVIKINRKFAYIFHYADTSNNKIKNYLILERN